MVNTFKTTALLAGLMGLAMLVGDYVAGEAGMLIAFLFAAVMNVGVWWFSDTFAVRSAQAVPVADARARLGREVPAWLEADVAELAERAGIPMPKVYVSPDPSPNAFATGRSPSKGLVCVTRGLLHTLDRRQIRGVLAHELGHIAHRDTLVSTVAATMAGAIGMIGRTFLFFGGRDEDRNPLAMMLMAVLAPVMAAAIHMAISRTREYGADAYAAEISGDPAGLADALERIHGIGQQIPQQVGAEATHYIANNFAGGLARWFSTHPPMDERVRRLRELAAQGRAA